MRGSGHKEIPLPMPEIDRIPDALLLAAVKRAVLHRDVQEGIPHWVVADHLALTRGAGTTRRLRPQLEALEAAGLLERSRLYGRTVWKATPKGRRRASPFRELPESPQHRAWREARELAAERIGEFRTAAGEVVLETFFLLDADPPTASDAWFAVGERLQRACWLLGSATYCLCEWAEPDDRRADLDERGGRRNTALWGQRPE
jgi:hypothetical protein